MSKGTVSGGTDGLYTATILKNDGTPEVKSAYCADLTEDLSGSVGIIEIAGDISNGVNVQPGYEGNAVYNAARDGEIYEVPQKPGTQPSAGVYWNWSMRAGWQKWRHPYRYGTVSAIDHDANSCTVTLDPCYATDTPDGKQLNVNQESSVTATFDYMSCNSTAFENGDSVIVKFTHGLNGTWANATVIGFKSEPKGCTWEDWSGGFCGRHTWKWNYIPVYQGFTQSGTCEPLPASLRLTGSGLLCDNGFQTYLIWDNAVDGGSIYGASKMIIDIDTSGFQYVRLFIYSPSGQQYEELTGNSGEYIVTLNDPQVNGFQIVASQGNPPTLGSYIIRSIAFEYI